MALWLITSAYEAVYASRGEITPESVLALPLIFAVLAISLRLVPSDWAGQEEERRKLSLKLFWGAQFGIMISTSLNAENLQLVEARILVSLHPPSKPLFPIWGAFLSFPLC